MESTVINQPQESPNPTGSNNNTAAQSHVGGNGEHQPPQGGGVGGVHPQETVGHNEDPRYRGGHNPFFVS